MEQEQLMDEGFEGQEIPDNEIYWATRPPEQLIQHLETQRKTWLDQSVSSGIFAGYLNAYWRNTIAYYSNVLDARNWTTSLSFEGKMGELIKMKIPKARTRVGQFCTLVTRQRYSYEGLTDVTDSNPLITAKLAKDIAKATHRSNVLDSKIVDAAETTSTVGMSFFVTTWRDDLGTDDVPDENGTMLRSGRPEITVEDISSVTWDWTQKDWQQVIHASVRLKRNRWDLVAKYRSKPDLVKKIIDLPSAESQASQWKNLTYVTGTQNEDMVWVTYWYHKPTSALENGRMFIYAGNDCWFEDGENPFKAIPFEPVIFERIKDTTLGYPLLSSLLPAQEMLDHSYSTQASNQSAFGLQALANPRGSKVSVEDVGGIKMFNYTRENAEGGGGKPEPMQFPDTPASIMNFAAILDKEIDDISLLNETIRGQSAANVNSGTMAATLSANSLEFMNRAQSAVVLALENTQNHVVMAYKNIASVEQTIEVTGDASLEYVKTFKSEDLKNLRRVTIRTQSGVLNSQSGRIQLGETLVQQGLVKNAQKLVLLYEGAPIEVLFEGSWNEEICVQAEIDALMEGKQVFPLETDNHPLYIAAYKKILDNPFIRTNTPLPQVIVPLMKQRTAMEMGMDPVLKAMLRGQPLPEMAPPQAGGGQQLPNQPQATDQAGTPAQPAQPAKPIPMQ